LEGLFVVFQQGVEGSGARAEPAEDGSLTVAGPLG
jgi:hypothetical protein